MAVPVFPEFRSLTLDDKREYEELVTMYPPVSDITFATLHIWWNLEGKLGFSNLNGNLVLNYSLPFDTKNSGWCLVGKHSVDQSISEMYEFLKARGRAQRLVHVPEFVVDEINNKDGLLIVEEADYHEYICDSQQLAQLEGRDHSRIRRKVNRFLREVEGEEIELKELDLTDSSVKDLIIESIEKWQPKRMADIDPDETGIKAIKETLNISHRIGTKNLALFIGGQLQGLTLYHLSHDEKHYIVTHLKVDYTIPFIFDYLTSQIAVQAVKDDIAYLNMEMDLGLEGLRQHKQGLRPVQLYKKYTITAK